jgi:hypothetical protein
MRRLLLHISAKLIAVIFCVVLLSGGCSAAGHEGFAIYLTRGDTPPSDMPALSQVSIADQPVIGMNDIVSYNAQTHELKLTANAFNRIASLQVPVRGTSFVACVDRKPIYCGAFWTPISSISYNGVTIWKPYNSSEPYVVALELGYPSSSFYGGQDPRNNADVIRSLEQAGKLIAKLTMATVHQLPHSMKGYELYSWSQDGQWHFTLVTGTDRNKTPEEIVSGEDFISEAGWLNVHLLGVDSIKVALSKLPEKESVFWLDDLRSEQTSQAGANISLPPGPVIDAIKEYARQRGLDFTVQTP